MKTLKRYLMPICFVLAVVLLLGMTLNLYKPIKSWTAKKVVNPDNLLLDEKIVWNENITRDGLTYECNADGSWHIYGTSTNSGGGSYLTLPGFSLDNGAIHAEHRQVCRLDLCVGKHDGKCGEREQQSVGTLFRKGRQGDR